MNASYQESVLFFVFVFWDILLVEFHFGFLLFINLEFFFSSIFRFLCRRRLSTVLVRLKFAEHLKEAVTYIEQGHIRVGPDTVTDPAFLVTRNIEDFVTWVDSSKIKRKVLEYNDKLDDYDAMNWERRLKADIHSIFTLIHIIKVDRARLGLFLDMLFARKNVFGSTREWS